MLALSVTSLVAARQLVGVAAGHGHLALVDHAAYAIAAAGAGARVADEPAALFTLLEIGARLAGQARVRARVRVRVRARARVRVRVRVRVSLGLGLGLGFGLPARCVATRAPSVLG